MGFIGASIGGKKFAGKDLILDYLLATRDQTEVVRCKTPIVKAYEKIRGHAYDKTRDDADLILVSKTMIRGGVNGNDNICGDYLRDTIPKVIERGHLPIIPDMRRKPENDACYALNMLCIKVEASEEVRKARGIARDGNLDNWKPDDATEMDVDEQQYHYVIDNNHNDGGKFAILQLEELLRRQGVRFQRKPIDTPMPGDDLRVCDPTHAQFWEVGYCIGRELSSAIAMRFPSTKTDSLYFRDQLMKAEGQFAA